MKGIRFALIERSPYASFECGIPQRVRLIRIEKRGRGSLVVTALPLVNSGADLHNYFFALAKPKQNPKNMFFWNDLLTCQNQKIFSFARAKK